MADGDARGGEAEGTVCGVAGEARPVAIPLFPVAVEDAWAIISRMSSFLVGVGVDQGTAPGFRGGVKGVPIPGKDDWGVGAGDGEVASAG